MPSSKFWFIQLARSTVACGAIARDALLDAIREYSNAARDDWAGDEALICTCFFVSERTIERECRRKRFPRPFYIGNRPMWRGRVVLRWMDLRQLDAEG